MISIKELKTQYPEFNQISDVTLAERVHKRFYSDLPKDNFLRHVLKIKQPKLLDVPPPDEGVISSIKQSPDVFKTSERTSSPSMPLSPRTEPNPYFKGALVEEFKGAGKTFTDTVKNLIPTREEIKSLGNKPNLDFVVDVPQFQPQGNEGLTSFVASPMEQTKNPLRSAIGATGTGAGVLLINDLLTGRKKFDKELIGDTFGTTLAAIGLPYFASTSFIKANIQSVKGDLEGAEETLRGIGRQIALKPKAGDITGAASVFREAGINDDRLDGLLRPFIGPGFVKQMEFTEKVGWVIDLIGIGKFDAVMLNAAKSKIPKVIIEKAIQKRIDIAKKVEKGNRQLAKDFKVLQGRKLTADDRLRTGTELQAPTEVAPTVAKPVVTPKPPVKPTEATVTPQVLTKPEVPVKAPWLMTKKEWVKEQGKLVSGQSAKKTMDLAKLMHRDHVKIWLSEGKPVSPEVLKDYPDLVKAKPTTPVATKQFTDPRIQIIKPNESAKIKGDILTVSVTPSTHEKGKSFQVTVFDNKKGIPLSDSQFDTFPEALKDGLNQAGFRTKDQLQASLDAGFLTRSELTPAEISIVDGTKTQQQIKDSHKAKPITPEVSPDPIQADEAISKIKSVSGSKISVLPRKKQLLKEIDEAIKNAPERTRDVPQEPDVGEATGTKEALTKEATIEFKIDGGAKIFNDKESLRIFRERVSKTPETMVVGGKPAKKPFAPGTSTKSEALNNIGITKDGKYYTDGRIIIKGKPPKGAKLDIEPEVDTKQVTDLIKEAEEKAVTAKKLYYVKSDEFGIGVSRNPIATKKNVESQPRVIFETEGKFFSYNQQIFNNANNRFPNATYKINDRPGATTNGALVVKEGKETVAVMMPLNTGEKDVFVINPPFATEAREAGLLPESPIPQGKSPSGSVFAEMGGFSESEIAQNPSFIEMPELVEIAKNLTGKYPGIKKQLTRMALGLAKFKGESAKIELLAEMFENPNLAEKVLSHEIGHIADWLPDKTMSKGNILGHIASIRKYMKSLLEEFPGAKQGILTPKDRAKLRRLAEKLAKAGETTVPEVTPQDVLNIWRDVKSFEKNRPLNDYIAKLTREQKSEIMKAAIKGKLPDWVDFTQSYKTADPDIKAIYRKLLKEEIEKRRLFEKDVILKELKTLTQKWKPFKEGLNPAYDAYRYSNAELYADAVSVLLNRPKLLKEVAPNFYKAFFNFLERKPEFEGTYLDILERIKKGRITVLRKRHEDIHKMFERDESIRNKLAEPKPMELGQAIKKELIDNNQPRIRKYKQMLKAGKEIPASENPIYWAEEYPYTHAAYSEYLRDVENTIRKPLHKLNISDADIGEYLFLKRASTERAKIANPKGQIGGAPKDQLAFLEAKLGTEKYKQLKTAADKLGKIRKEHIISILKEADMYDAKLQSFIENNIENYAKYDVTAYLESKFGSEQAGRLYQKVGTLEDISNPFMATILQDASLMRAAAIKMERKTFVDMMIGSFPDEIKPAKTEWNGRFHVPMKPKNPDTGMISFLDKGEVKSYYLPREIADNFKKEPLEAGKIVRMIQLGTAPFKEIFVGKNPLWTAWNIQRDFFALAKNLPKGDLPKALWYTIKSIPDATKDVFKNVSTPDVAEMYKQDMLVVGRYYAALDKSPDQALDKVMRSYGLTGQKYQNKVVIPLMKFWEFLDKPGRFSERLIKIAGYKQLKATPVKYLPSAKRFQKLHGGKPPKGYARQGVGIDVDKEIAHIIRTQAGSPDFLRKGHLSPLYNSLYLFSNAGKEGWRASYEAAKNNPLSYTWKTFKYDIAPKILMYGAGLGAFGYGYKSMMDNISDRDKTNYKCVPLGVTPTGKTIYMVSPHDFMGQAIAGIFWKSMNTNKTKDIQDLFDFTMGGLPYTSLNPVVATFIDTSRYIAGKNPYDSWGSRNVIPDTVFEAGGERSHKVFARHLWNSMGGGVILRLKYEKVDKVVTELEKIYNYPIIGSGLSRFIRVSDYGTTEQLREVKLEARKENANDLLDAKDVLYKIIDGKPLSDTDLSALAKKPGVITDVAVLKLIADKLGETALEEVLSARSNNERDAVLKKMTELYGGGK